LQQSIIDMQPPFIDLRPQLGMRPRRKSTLTPHGNGVVAHFEPPGHLPGAAEDIDQFAGNADLHAAYDSPCVKNVNLTTREWSSAIPAAILAGMARTAKKPLDSNSVAYRLWLSREILELSQKKFAENAGISAHRYNPFETGRRLLPLVVADCLYKKYGLTPDWFYYGKTQELPTWFTKALRSRVAAE
jgi:hypothetical protein